MESLTVDDVITCLLPSEQDKSDSDPELETSIESNVNGQDGLLLINCSNSYVLKESTNW